MGGTGTLSMQTNGGITCPAGYVCPGIGVPGRLQGAGCTGGLVNVRVSCDASKTLRNIGGSGGAQDLTAAAFVLQHAGSGNSITCGGLNTGEMTVNFSNNAANNVFSLGTAVSADNPRFGGQYALGNHPSGEVTVRARCMFLGFIEFARLDALVDTLVSFQGILGIFAGSDMDFGAVEITGAPGAGSTVSLGSNGTRSFAGNFSGTGAGTAGSVSFGGLTDGEMYEISCNQSATLTNATGSASIDVTGLEITHALTPGSYGSASDCNGLSTPAIAGTYSSSLGTNLLLGGVLNGATASGTLSGTHSSGNPGGSYIEVQMIRP